MSATADSIHDEVDEVDDEIQERLADLRERAAEIDSQVRRVVREHPFLSLAGAVAAGYVVGRLIRR